MRPLDQTLTTIAARGSAGRLVRRIAELDGFDRLHGLRRVGLAIARRLGGERPVADVHRGRGARRARQALLVTHDLTQSGAPKVVLELAAIFDGAGYGTTLVSPSDGPLRRRFEELGTAVVVDPGVFERRCGTLAALGRAVHVAFCNTVVTREAVRALHAAVPTFWYLHEVSLIEQRLVTDAALASDFGMPHELWCGSELSARLVRPCRPDVRVVPYGIATPSIDAPQPPDGHRVRLAIFGSLEPRKGQDLAIEALRRLPPETRDGVAVTFYGRTLDAAFAESLRLTAAGLPVTFGGELDEAAYRDALEASDLVLVPSRDDTLPLVSLDALASRRVLACTATVGTAAYLHDGVDGFVAASPTAEAIATTLTRALAERASWPSIAMRGFDAFTREFGLERFTRIVLSAADAAIATKAPR